MNIKPKKVYGCIHNSDIIPFTSKGGISYVDLTEYFIGEISLGEFICGVASIDTITTVYVPIELLTTSCDMVLLMDKNYAVAVDIYKNIVLELESCGVKEYGLEECYD